MTNGNIDPNVLNDPGLEDEGYKTVEELEKDYPELVGQVRDSVKTENIKTAKLLEKKFPKLVKEIREDEAKKVREALDTRPGHLRVSGFLLEVDDPFAEGTARVFGRLKGIDAPALPCVLPFKDKHTAKALESYILRAGGGGETKRVAAAREALKKIKKS